MDKNRLKFLAKLFVAVILLYYLVEIVNYKDIIEAIENSNKQLIVLAFLLSILNIYLQFKKWKVVCNSLLGIVDDSKIWRSLFYGLSAGIVTPIRVGEYLGRKLAFKDVGLLKVTISTIIEKFASLFIVLIFGSVAASIFISIYYSFLYSLPIILFLFALITFTVYLSQGYSISSSFFNKLADKFDFVKNLKIELSYVRQINARSVRLLMSYSLLFYLVIIMQYAILAKAFDQNGNVFMFLLAGILVMFVKSFLSFLSFADLGIRESTSVFLMNKMGYTKAIGFNSAIFLFLINLVIPALIGMFLLFKRNNE